MREVKATSCSSTDRSRDQPLEASLSILRAILSQTLTLARLSYANVATVSKESLEEQGNIYPTDEVEFLASILFNLAIDLYLSGMDHAAKEWAKVAMEIAEILEMKTIGRGSLARKLRTKIDTLGWI